MAARFTRMCRAAVKRGHRRKTSESNPITAAAGSGPRDSTSSSCGSGFQDYYWGLNDHEETSSSSASNAPFKRVIVVVDQSKESRMALLWALSHVVHKLDVVTLLYVLGAKQKRPRGDSKGYKVLSSLKSLCLERRPEIEVEVLTVEGEKGPVIVSQAEKLEASVLVLGQRKSGFFWRFLRWGGDALIDYCLQNAQCLTLAVRKKSKKLGGYLINTKWQKNFWLLA